MAKSTGMVVRIPDDLGKLVTYEAGGPLARQLGTTQLSCWSQAGAVRTIKRAGVTFYAVVDAALLCKLTPAETRERGIARVPERYLRNQAKWSAEAGDRTREVADRNGQIWDDHEKELVLVAFEDGQGVEDIAKAVGRTYQAVENVIGQLRRAGDLPPIARGRMPEWMRRILLLLTPGERARLLGEEDAFDLAPEAVAV